MVIWKGMRGLKELVSDFKVFDLFYKSYNKLVREVFKSVLFLT